MNDITRDRDSLKREHAVSAQLLSSLTSLGILIASNSVKMLVSKTSKFGLKVTEVLIGSLNFYANPDETLVGRKPVHSHNRIVAAIKCREGVACFSGEDDVSVLSGLHPTRARDSSSLAIAQPLSRNK